MKPKHIKLFLCYKNFSKVSHIGLGVSALNTANTLQAQGVDVEVHSVKSSNELICLIQDRSPDERPTHVVMSAPWIPNNEWLAISRRFCNIKFVVNCHSNVGFLQADPNGVKVFIANAKLQQGSLNFHVSGNSMTFADWVTRTYSVPCLTLPNLYYLTGNTHMHKLPFHFGHSTLRIGAFGATRPLKNMQTMAAAALTVATETRTPLEFWISAGRLEGGGLTVLNAMKEMFDGIAGVRIIENSWQDWPSFRQTLRHMHLLMQMSYTESFNMVTADGVAEGVPSVVSTAIDWIPDHWAAHFDDAMDIARVARQLLTDVNTNQDGLAALEDHNQDGLRMWMRFLGLRQQWVKRAPIWVETPDVA